MVRAELIRALRESRFWTQTDLAELTGLATSTIQRAERGQRIGASAAKDIGRLLGLDVAALVTPSLKEIRHRLDIVGRAPPPPIIDWIPRDNEVAILSDGFAKRRTGGYLGAISGPVGIGKSTVARAVADTIGHRFGAPVVWIDSGSLATPERTRVTQTDIASALGFASVLGAPSERTPEAFNKAFRSLLWTQGALVIVDDIEPASALDALYAGEPNATCIITTRFRHLAERHSPAPLELGPLPDDAVHAAFVRLVGKARIEADPTGVPELIDLVAGIPQNVLLAGHALRLQTFVTPGDYARSAKADAAQQSGISAATTIHAGIFAQLERMLSPDAKTLLAEVSAFGQAPFDPAWAVSASTLSPSAARRALSELTDVFVLTADIRVATRARRTLRAHTNIAFIARALAGSRGRMAATQRVLAHLPKDMQAAMADGLTGAWGWWKANREAIQTMLDQLVEGVPRPRVWAGMTAGDLPECALPPVYANLLIELLTPFGVTVSLGGLPGLGEWLPLATAAARASGRASYYGRMLRTLAWDLSIGSFGWHAGHALFAESERVSEADGDCMIAAGTVSLSGSTWLALSDPERNASEQERALAMFSRANADPINTVRFFIRIAAFLSRTNDPLQQGPRWARSIALCEEAVALAARSPDGAWHAALARWNCEILKHADGRGQDDRVLAAAATELLTMVGPHHHPFRAIMFASLADRGLSFQGDDPEALWGRAREELLTAAAVTSDHEAAAECLTMLTHLVFFAAFPGNHQMHAKGTCLVATAMPKRSILDLWEMHSIIIYRSTWIDRLLDNALLTALDVATGPIFGDAHALRLATDMARRTRAIAG